MLGVCVCLVLVRSEVLHPLGLELQVVLSCHVGAGIERRFSGRTVSVLTCRLSKPCSHSLMHFPPSVSALVGLCACAWVFVECCRSQDNSQKVVLLWAPTFTVPSYRSLLTRSHMYEILRGINVCTQPCGTGILFDIKILCCEERRGFPRVFKHWPASHSMGTLSRLCLLWDHRHLIHSSPLWCRLALLHAVASHRNVWIPSEATL